MALQSCLLPNIFSMCLSRSCTEISLPSSRVWAHLPGYLWRLTKIWGCILASSYCSRKAFTLKCQSVYVTSTPGSVNLKIGISNLAGANCFFSLLPLWPLCWYQQPVALLAVESGTLLSGEEGGEPPLLTTVHCDLGGHPCSHTAPA